MATAIREHNPIFGVVLRCEHCHQVLDKHRFHSVIVGPEIVKCNSCGTENSTGEKEWLHMAWLRKLRFIFSFDVLILSGFFLFPALLLIDRSSLTLVYLLRGVRGIISYYSSIAVLMSYRLHIKSIRIKESNARIAGQRMEKPELDLDEYQ